MCNKEQKKINAGNMRQQYHFMPETGWMNDPNGLVYYKNLYHYFYQHYPFDAVWGQMHWGHAVSSDLLHWTYLPTALTPDKEYDNEGTGGCFSGSAIEHDGQLYLFYTGAVEIEGQAVQTQCVAYSENGVDFVKYEENPVITAPDGYDAANFRDPKVWKHEEYFYLVCGVQKDGKAQALIYRSDNLLQWDYLNVMTESFGEWGTMWECPDIYPLGDKYIFQCSPIGTGGRKAVYFVGDLNYETGKFNYSVIGEADWGLDYYAAQSFLDSKGRRLTVAWANGWDWMPWWRSFGPTVKDGWCGFFALPREVRLEKNGRLAFYPIEELRLLRRNEWKRTEFLLEEIQEGLRIKERTCFEVMMTISLEKSSASAFTLIVKAANGKQGQVRFDLREQMLSVDRTGLAGWSSGVSKSTLLLQNKKELRVHMFVDRCSVEVYTDDYKTIHSCNMYTEEKQTSTHLKAESGALYVQELLVWDVEL